jgi:hypothetical protein
MKIADLTPEFIQATVQVALVQAGSDLTANVVESSHGAAGPTYAVSFVSPEAEPTT